MNIKDNSGALFKNNRREKPTHKDYEGTCMVDGKIYWMAAWIRESEKAGRYLSIAFTEKPELPE